MVNKVSASHIGCLVHGCFNASIPKPEKMSSEQWQTLEVDVGDELEFEVFRLDSDAAGVFCIRGKLNVSRLVFPGCWFLKKLISELETNTVHHAVKHLNCFHFHTVKQGHLILYCCPRQIC